MDLFTVIDDAIAIARFPKGVLKQVKMYARGRRVFIAHGGGYIRLTSMFDGVYGTSNPDVKVVEFEADGVDRTTGEPTFRPAPKAVAA